MNKQQIEWLITFEQHKDDLIAICNQFMRDPAVRDKLNVLLVNQNIGGIGAILQETWDLAPDQAWIHGLRGWGVLCDLCSDFVFGDLLEEN